MNYKKILINTISIFVISSIIHFIYNIFPSFITSIFTPVNESIFEHLKLIFTSTLIYSLIIKDKKYSNYYLRGIITNIILLIIYMPFRLILGEILIVTLIILFISIFISEILITRININTNKKTSILIIILIYSIFTYLTYKPIKTFLFKDTTNNSYGIKK